MLKNHEINFDDPSSLFKFYSINKNSLDCLVQEYVWLGDPSTFNDPFDNIVSFNKIMKAESCFELSFDLNRAIELMKSSALHLKYFKNFENREDPELRDRIIRFHENLISQLGFACFSSSPYSTLMWSHYADSHKGLCLEFDRVGDLRSDLCDKVNYTSDINWKASIPQFIENPLQFLKEYLYVKREEWSYEREWRLTHEFHMWFEIQNEERRMSGLRPKSVIFGLRTPTEDKKLLGKILPSHTNLYECSLRNEEIEINPCYIEELTNR